MRASTFPRDEQSLPRASEDSLDSRQRPFSPGISAPWRPYPAGYAFPLSFDGWPSLLESSRSRCRIPPSLWSAYWRLGPTMPRDQTASGLPCSALLRCDWGGYPLCAGVVVSAPRATLRPMASEATRVWPPPCDSFTVLISHHPVIWLDDASTRIRSRLPVQSSPCLWHH